MAGAFKVFNKAKGALGRGEIALNSGNFRLALVSGNGTQMSLNCSASTFASLKTDIGGFIASYGNYSADGNSLSLLSWTQGTTTWTFDAEDWSVSHNSATGLSNIKQCVIYKSAGWPIAYCCLSAANFDLAQGNKLTIAFHADGIFTLT